MEQVAVLHVQQEVSIMVPPIAAIRALIMDSFLELVHRSALIFVHSGLSTLSEVLGNAGIFFLNVLDLANASIST